MTRKAVSKGKEWLYEVFADGVKIGQRKTSREYYAVAVWPAGHIVMAWAQDENGKYPRDENGRAVMSPTPLKTSGLGGWIGRADLIPGHIDIRNGAKHAVLSHEFFGMVLPAYDTNR
jgi:hypothetical protein